MSRKELKKGLNGRFEEYTLRDLVFDTDTLATDSTVKTFMLSFMIMKSSHANNNFSAVGAGELSFIMLLLFMLGKGLLREKLLATLLTDNDVFIFNFDFIFVKILHNDKPI